MTNNELRNCFNKAIGKTEDPDTIAKMEVCREYFTNPEFKKALEDYTFEKTCRPPQEPAR